MTAWGWYFNHDAPNPTLKVGVMTFERDRGRDEPGTEAWTFRTRERTIFLDEIAPGLWNARNKGTFQWQGRLGRTPADALWFLMKEDL